MSNNDVSNNLVKDPLFKGCTRPAMFFGVPVVPLACVTAVFVLLGVWTSILVPVVCLPPAIIIMRSIAKSDDQQFRLLGLKILFRIIHRNKNKGFWRASTYSPIEFKKRRK